MNAKLEETGRYDFQQKAVLTDTNGTVVAETWARTRYAISWVSATCN